MGSWIGRVWRGMIDNRSKDHGLHDGESYSNNFGDIKDLLLIRYAPLSHFVGITAGTLADLNENGILEEDLSEELINSLTPCFVALNDELGYALMVDMGDCLRWVNQNDLDCWGVSFQEAFEAGKNNLDVQALKQEKISSHAWKISSSQVLGPHIYLAQLEAVLKLTSSPWIFIPATDQIFVVDGSHKMSLEKTIKAVLEVFETTEAKILNGKPYLLSSSGDFEPVGTRGWEMPCWKELSFYDKSETYSQFSLIGPSLISQLPESLIGQETVKISEFEAIVDMYPDAESFMSMTTVFTDSEESTLIPDVDVVALFNVSYENGEPCVNPRFIPLDGIKTDFPDTIHSISGPLPCYLLDGKALKEKTDSV